MGVGIGLEVGAKVGVAVGRRGVLGVGIGVVEVVVIAVITGIETGHNKQVSKDDYLRRAPARRTRARQRPR